jgi:hypothetical protein
MDSVLPASTTPPSTIPIDLSGPGTADTASWNPGAATTRSRWRYGPFGTGFMVAMGVFAAMLVFSAAMFLIVVALLALGLSGLHSSLQHTSTLMIPGTWM